MTKHRTARPHRSPLPLVAALLFALCAVMPCAADARDGASTGGAARPDDLALDPAVTARYEELAAWLSPEARAAFDRARQAVRDEWERAAVDDPASVDPDAAIRDQVARAFPDAAADADLMDAAVFVLTYEVVRDVIDQATRLSELGEMESLRLQMAMDRLSKMMGTLAHLLDELSRVPADITQNIK